MEPPREPPFCPGVSWRTPAWSLLRTLLVGAAAVAAFEVGARCAGWLDPTERPDVYLGFPGTPPLYRAATDSGGDRVRRRSPNKPLYRDLEFPEHKPPGEFRIVCVGGSSVRSADFMEPDGSFPHMLEMLLAGRWSDRRPFVINAGGGGTGSVQYLEVVREVLDYEPDLIVVYPEGGEKNLLPPWPEGVLAERDEASPLRVALRRVLARSRLYALCREIVQRLRPAPPRAPEWLTTLSSFYAWTVARPFAEDSFIRVFELKRDRPPLLMPRAIPPDAIERAQARLVRNLGAIADLAKARGVPVLFCLPLRNPRSFFHLRFHVDPAEIRSGMQGEWRRLYEDGLRAKVEGRTEDALVALRAVRDLYVDDRDELLAFDLGECLEKLGRFDEARAEYARPLLTHPARRLIAQAAHEHGMPLVDPWPDVVAISEHGLPGWSEFTDSFHPMPRTNRAIAGAIVDAMGRHGIGPPMRALTDERVRWAEQAVAELVRICGEPIHTRMMRAILAGDEDLAIELGWSLPEDELLVRRIPEPLFLGWALMRRGRVDAARKLWARLSENHPGLAAPELDSDADVVRNAYHGDVAAWL